MRLLPIACGPYQDGAVVLNTLKTLLLVVVALPVVFLGLQNLQAVTVALSTYAVTLPLRQFVIGVYLLGMFSGGLLLSLFRSLRQRKRRYW